MKSFSIHAFFNTIYQTFTCLQSTKGGTRENNGHEQTSVHARIIAKSLLTHQPQRKQLPVPSYQHRPLRLIIVKLTHQNESQAKNKGQN